MGQQLLAFRAKFGRDAGPDDPIFFDPDADEPVPLPPVKAEAVMTAAMEDVGIDPALIYAWQHTGMLVTEANRGLFEPEDIAEWDEAVRRFDALGEDSDQEGDAWDDDWLPDDDLDLPVAGHDARLLFASPNFDDAESIAAFLLTTIDGAGVVVSQLLWHGRSDLGWPARRRASRTCRTRWAGTPRRMSWATSMRSSTVPTSTTSTSATTLTSPDIRRR